MTSNHSPWTDVFLRRLEIDQARARRYVRNLGRSKLGQDRLDSRGLLGVANTALDPSQRQLVRVDDVKDGRDHAVEIVIELTGIDRGSCGSGGCPVDPAFRALEEVPGNNELCFGRAGHWVRPV
jgi:hypothetical protein